MNQRNASAPKRNKAPGERERERAICGGDSATAEFKGAEYSRNEVIR